MTGLIVTPFLITSAMQGIANINEKQFKELMEERKKLIPIWMRAIKKSNDFFTPSLNKLITIKNLPKLELFFQGVFGDHSPRSGMPVFRLSESPSQM